MDFAALADQLVAGALIADVDDAGTVRLRQADTNQPMTPTGA